MLKRFVWNKENTEHIAKHFVSTTEVMQVFAQKHLTRKMHNELKVAYGRTFYGRYLFVVYKKLSVTRNGRGKDKMIYVITARDMTGKERNLFKRSVR